MLHHSNALQSNGPLCLKLAQSSCHSASPPGCEGEIVVRPRSDEAVPGGIGWRLVESVYSGVHSLSLRHCDTSVDVDSGTADCFFAGLPMMLMLLMIPG